HHPYQFVLRVVLVLSDCAANLGGFTDHVAVVVVLVNEVRVLQKFISLTEVRLTILVGVDPVANRIVVESLQWICRQRIDRLYQSIQRVVRVTCSAIIVSLRLLIPNPVISVGEGIYRGGSQLMCQT